MNRRYYLWLPDIDKQPLGPFEEKQLTELAQRALITMNTLAYAEGNEEWQTLDTLTREPFRERETITPQHWDDEDAIHYQLGETHFARVNPELEEDEDANNPFRLILLNKSREPENEVYLTDDELKRLGPFFISKRMRDFLKILFLTNLATALCFLMLPMNVFLFIFLISSYTLSVTGFTYIFFMIIDPY